MNSPTVTYWATSFFTSKTFWINLGFFLIAALSLTEVVSIVPLKWMPSYNALVAIVNMALRFTAVRPVALIAPGSLKAVEVEKLG